MKKLVVGFLLLLIAMMLISCGGTSDTPADAEEENTGDTAVSSDAEEENTGDTAASSDTEVEDTTETAPSSDGPVQVTMLGTIKPEIQEPFEEAVAAYNEAQDQYEVVIIPFDGDPVQMMTSLFASGNMPNLINMGQEFSLFQETSCDVTDTEFSQLAFDGTQADVTVDGRV